MIAIAITIMIAITTGEPRACALQRSPNRSCGNDRGSKPTMAALLPSPDTFELLTPLIVAASVVIVAIAINRVVALTRSIRARRVGTTPAPVDIVADFPLNPLEERKTRPWRAPTEREAIPSQIDRVDTSANTAPLRLDPAAARSR